MAAPSYTYTLTNGTTADASQVMQNFNDVLNGITDGTKDLSISALTCAGTATLNGNINLGNASGDDITVTGSLASTLPIKTNTTYDLGTSTKGLANIYMGGTSTFTGKITQAALAASRIWTIPDAGADASFVMTAGTQTIGGAKTFSSSPAVTVSSGTAVITLDSSANNSQNAQVQTTCKSSGGVTQSYAVGANISTTDAAFNIYDVTSSKKRIGITTAGAVSIGSSGENTDHTCFGQWNMTARGLTDITRADTTSGTVSTFRFKDGSGDTCGSIDINTTANTTAYTTSSDVRLKDHIETLLGALGLIESIDARVYERKCNPGVKEIGFIAQELEQAVPLAVSESDGSEGIKMVDYSRVTPVLWQAVKELKKEVDQLKSA